MGQCLELNHKKPPRRHNCGVSDRQVALLMKGVHHSYFQSVLNFMVHFCLSVNSSAKSDFKMLFLQQVVKASGHHTLLWDLVCFFVMSLEIEASSQILEMNQCFGI